MKIRQFLLSLAVIVAIGAIILPIYIQKLPMELQLDKDILMPFNLTDSKNSHGQKPLLNKVKVTQPTPDSPNLSSTAWVIQIKQLTDLKSAKALVTELRHHQFSAFTQSFGNTWLVNVGPELDQQHLQELEERLTAEGYQGIYAHYYPLLGEVKRDA